MEAFEILWQRRLKHWASSSVRQPLGQCSQAGAIASFTIQHTTVGAITWPPKKKNSSSVYTRWAFCFCFPLFHGRLLAISWFCPAVHPFSSYYVISVFWNRPWVCYYYDNYSYSFILQTQVSFFKAHRGASHTEQAAGQAMMTGVASTAPNYLSENHEVIAHRPATKPRPTH